MSTTENLELQRSRQLDIASKLHIAADAHVQSFNFFLEDGLEKICKHLNPLEIHTKQLQTSQKQGPLKPVPFNYCKIWFEDISIGFPTRYEDLANTDARIYPWECRMSGGTYSAPLLVTIGRILNDGPVEKRKINLGHIPIMLKSKHCHLANLSAKEMVAKNEDGCEVGGYFI